MPGLTTTLVQQVLLGSLSILLVIAATTLLRNRRLGFAGAMLWVGMGGLGVLGALFLPLVNTIGAFLGVLPAAVLAAVASVLLGTIAFLLAMQVSRLERALQDTAEAVGMQRVAPELHPNPNRAMLAVVPAYNEAGSVEAVVDGLRALGLQVLVVDDGSTDGTGVVAHRSGASVLSLPTNLGVGGALRAGLRYARRQGFSAVIQCDGDGQHPPDSVAKLLAERSDDVDLLIGSRFTGGYSGIRGSARRGAIRLLALSASRASGRRITDSTSGLRIIREPLLSELCEHMPQHYLGDTFEVIYAAGRAGYIIREIPVMMAERAHGTSTASPTTAAKMTLRVFLATILGVHQPFARRSSAT